MASGYALPTGLHNIDHDTQLAAQHVYAARDSQRLDGAPTGLGINGADGSHLHSHSHSHESHVPSDHAPGTPSKSKIAISNFTSLGKTRTRTRGVSDLGRAASLKGNAYRPSLGGLPGRGTWDNLPQELLTVALICLPVYAASYVVHSTTAGLGQGQKHALHDANQVQHLRGTILESEIDHHSRGVTGVGQAALLSSMVLLGISALVRTQPAGRRVLSSGYASPRMPTNKSPHAKTTPSVFDHNVAKAVLLRCLGVFLPLFAAVKLGGWRACIILLSTHMSGLVKSAQPTINASSPLPHWWLQSVILVTFVADIVGLTSRATLIDTTLGYASMITAVFFTTTPLRVTNGTTSTTVSGRSTPVSSPVGRVSTKANAAETASSAGSEAYLSVMSAVVLLVVAIIMFIAIDIPTATTSSNIAAALLSVVTSVAAARYARLTTLRRSPTKAAYLAGVLGLALFGSFTSPHFWPNSISNIVISGVFVTAVMLDARTTKTPSLEQFNEKGTITHQHRQHEEQSSRFTRHLLDNCEPGSLVHSILCEKDSRRIAYFTCLNFAFMLVQGLYGYLSGSLGLLSDTVHMFFDCLGLIVGLGAAVASKWPPSKARPFGWGKLNTLAGFGNGVFLMLVSVEFVFEAMEGIFERRELRRVKELFVVSTLGLLVNLVGLFAFGHAHAGHDHSHGHDHAHGDHAHNENMHGIFLHVAADAGGSLAVIISTALTIFNPWYLWDPLATIIIAILIFAAAIPLVVSSGQKLLLIVPEETEYIIKNFLQEVVQIRGVLAYAAPRIWSIGDGAGTVHGHDHAHSHDHSHEHSHKHEHSHDHEHSHSHGHDHGHSDTHDAGDNLDHQHASHDSHHHHDHRQHVASLTGSIHIITVPFADLEDIREQVEELALSKGMSLVIHVEHDGEEQCWCGGVQKS